MKTHRAATAKGESTTSALNSDFGIVIVTHNRRIPLRRLLDRLSGSEEVLARTIVIDNGSSDGTSEMVGSEFSEATIVYLPTNHGVPYARNLGALVATPDVLLFLDDDGWLDVREVQILVHLMDEDPTLAIVGLDVVDDGGGESDPTDEARGSSRREWPGRTLVPSRTFPGGAALVRRAAFIQAGMFPAHFFYSLEEDDLTLRLLRLGYRVAFCPWVRFFHRRAADPNLKRDKAFFYYRNRVYIAWRNLPLGTALVESFVTLGGGFARSLFTSCLRGFVAGYMEALVELPELVRFEREPLTRAQYRRYRKAFGSSVRLTRRLRNLISDVRCGKRLDWL